MIDCIKEYGEMSKYTVKTENGCNKMEIEYITRMKSKSDFNLKSHFDRLVSIEGSSTR